VGGQNVPLHRRVVRFHGLTAESGVMVLQIEPGSPAAKAGLQEGDIILAFEDRVIASIDDLHRLMTDEWVGKAAKVLVLRKLERLELMIVPAESPAAEDRAR